MAVGFDANQHRRALAAFMKAHDLNPAQWETLSDLGDGTLRKFMDGTTKTVTGQTLAKLADGAGKKLERDVLVAELTGEATVLVRELKEPSQSVSSLDHNHPLLQKEKMRVDVPLRGTTLVGAGDSFQMDGEVDNFRRPPRLDGRKDVFCIYVEGSSMEPRYSPGELLYLETIKPPRPGEFVVVEVSPAQPDAPKQAYLRMLVSDIAGKVKLRQFNPEKTLDIAREKISQIYRVMPWAEVMGV